MQNNGQGNELIQDLLNGDCDELNRKVGLFLDQCPSFLHSVGRSRFFPAFFFGMFATAFDSGIRGCPETSKFKHIPSLT